jgi:hypothetical protein
LLRDRHFFLTIRNLTSAPSVLSNSELMHVVKVTRTRFRRSVARKERKSFRELTRDYFRTEKGLEFAIEALVFVVLWAVCAWPIVAAVGALGELFQRAA